MNIFTINSGSSSIKFSVYRIADNEELVFMGSVEGIGTTGLIRIRNGSGSIVLDKKITLPDHGAALKHITAWLETLPRTNAIDSIGHRLVHGGRAYTEPHLITPALLDVLKELIPFAPDHLPHELHAIRELSTLFPGMPQVACFDTAIHRTMPEVAKTYALPQEVRQHGVERYGFHGLSYEYILGELSREEGPERAQGRVIIAHLGNGASMAAFNNGKSMDTTMGFTPAGGLVMSTRSGDLDPGTIVYLLKEKGMDAAAINRIVNSEAGLLGISGKSPDMQELLDLKTKGDGRAALAIRLFCYQASKFLGGLVAVLGGIDTLVFTGGIGEHVPSVREDICTNLGFLGIRIDPLRNIANTTIISAEGSSVQVRVMHTNEEVMIARHTSAVVRKLKKAA